LRYDGITKNKQVTIFSMFLDQDSATLPASLFIQRTTKFWFTSLGLLALLTVGGFLWLEFNLNTYRNDAALINRSGLQRMYSQQIALYSLQMFSMEGEVRETAREQLATAIARMYEEHLYSTQSANLSEEQLNLYFAQPDQLDSKVQAYLAAAERLTKLPDNELRLNNADLQFILEQSPVLLDGLDQNVVFYQQANDGHFYSLRLTNLFQTILVLLTIGIQAWFVIRPTIQRLRDKTDKLVNEINAHQKAENDLVENQRFIEHITKTIPDIVYVFDLNERRNIYANREITQALGYTVEEIQTMGDQLFPALIHPDDLKRVIDFEAQLASLENGGIAEIEYRMRRRNGEWCWLHSRETIFQRDHNGIPSQKLGVASDITASKQFQESMGESEERFRVMAEVSPFGIFMTNSEGDCVYTNPAYQKMSGLSAEAALGKGWGTAVHPDDRERVFNDWYEATRNQQPFETIMRYVHQDGTVVWGDVKAVPLQYHETTGYLGTVEDITERKKFEEALRQSEAEYRSVVNSVREVIFQADEYGQWTFLNPAWTEITGYKVEESLGENFLRFVHPDDLSDCLDLFVPLIEGQQEDCRQEIRFLTQDGTLRWFDFQARLVFSENHHKIAIAGTLTDISESKLMQAKLSQERNLLRTLIDTLPDYIFAKDLDGRFLISNQAHAQAVRVDNPDDMIGKTAYDYWEPELAAKYDADDRAVMTSGLPLLNQERVSVNATSEKIWVSTSKVPLRDSAGNIVGVIGLSRDITDRKKAEERERQLAVEREHSQLLTDFITNTSHDLKTPLTIISSGAYVLFKSAKPEQRENKLQEINDQVNRISSLIDQLHRMAKLDSIDNFDMQTVDFGEIAHSLNETFEKRAHEKGIEFVWACTLDFPLIRGDRLQLQQALSYVYDNALMYTQAGGHIEVTGDWDEQQFYITVRDTGVGISPEDLPYIFDRFYKANKARTPDSSGVGLGLTMAKRIIEIHGGTIAVESLPGQGTSVKIWLPVAGTTVETR
jgi:PAS domain S-box-containing protein